MSPALTERLVSLACALRQAAHGSKDAIYQAACQELGMSRATLHRKLKEVAIMGERKRRRDAGKTALSRDEALVISGVLTNSARKNNKRLFGVGDAVEALRADEKVRAEGIDKSTGEVRPLSHSTIHRALRAYKLHPDQLAEPAPATQLASLHPNHVWQIDASLCVLYYLKPGAGARARESGLQVMEADKFYKNKPKNLARIAANRVWSYELTDHTSDWIYAEYVMGAESGDNLCSVLINAMQERGGQDLMHGVPKILMLDPGSANTAAMTKNLCKSLGIRLMPHAPGNARATGQVENARNIIERKFEARLKFEPVANLDELNERARQWRMAFNATAIHRRHGRSRSAVWMTITAAQLEKAPPVEVCRELAVAAPEPRTVTPLLRVQFAGREWDVSTVPQVMVGEKVLVTRNPWRDDAAQVVRIDADGREVFHVVAEVKKNEFGFAETAAVIGERYRAPADTPAQTTSKEIERLVMGADTQGEAEAARKAKRLPFGGEFHAFKTITDTELPNYLPRRGRAHSLTPPTVEFPPLSHVEAARRLKARLGERWTSEHFARLAKRFPEGVPEDQLDTVAAELEGARAALCEPAARLRAVGGA
ncbi:DDE-type integrase/transposase/recombinase [Rhodocyclus gracilis]|uniref:DDE-type integrase/transposase/recombinase n=1 Tax=Rhodocyclus tenuis TaxID=1066 RepID=A0A6L5JX41_RHOTE|nr:DDE-type integrase/transposase/recombinase [Rhodocyclus gracilis]MQY50768.1 DDE-type integrase/transposase/recombinase [Rhodocyclus gracilis]